MHHTPKYSPHSGTPMPNVLHTLDRSNLGDQVYERIATALLNGQMRPNDKLTIRGLADQLGVSTTPVRDAIKQLTQDHVLEQRSAKDVRVPVMTHATYLEILDIRLQLEGLSAERAVDRATPAVRAALRNLLERNDRAAAEQNHVLATQGNQEFHLALSRAADMPNLQRILKGLWLRMGPLVAAYYETAPTNLNAKHYEVLDAIDAQDASAARLAIQQDISSAKGALLDQISAFDAVADR